MGDASDAISTSLENRAKEWRRNGPGRDGILVIALSVCHSLYFGNDGDETRAIAKDPIDETSNAPWRDDLRGVSGELFVGDVSLGNELRTRARLVENPERHLPESLAFLASEQNLAELTGFQRQTEDAG